MPQNNNRRNYNKLHKRVHWRRIKNIVRSLGEVEKVQLDKYNFSNICCYECQGVELQGKNVRFKTPGNQSCFVFDNSYEMFELKNISNRSSSSYGNFLFLAHNTSFGYWVFGELDVKLNYKKTQNSSSSYENVSYEPFGAYTFADEENATSFRKVANSKSITYGRKRKQRSLI